MPSTSLHVEFLDRVVELVRRPRGVVSGLDLRLHLTSTPASNLSSAIKNKILFPSSTAYQLRLPPKSCCSFNSFIQSSLKHQNKR